MPERRLVPIALFEDSKSPAVCRGCGAAIDWYETPRGKRMPMNRDAVPLRSETDESTWRVLAFFDAADSHWATCPAAADFRTQRKP